MITHSNPYLLRGHIVKPKSVLNIRKVANNARNVLGLTDDPVSLPDFLESLTTFGITVDVIEDRDFTMMMAGVEAVCMPDTATIALTAATYAAATRNDARTRFTIFHEVGHFVMQHTKALARGNFVAKPYLDSEWQADQFAAEMTMPLHVMLARRILTPTAVAGFFGVSFEAASNRLRLLGREGVIPCN